jgi:hypothetical protein
VKLAKLRVTNPTGHAADAKVELVVKDLSAPPDAEPEVVEIIGIQWPIGLELTPQGLTGVIRVGVVSFSYEDQR